MRDRLPSGLPDLVADDEELARILRSSSHFSSVAVKASAFLPGKDDMTSVVRHGSEPRNDLWQLASAFLGAEARFHGAAVFSATAVRDNKVDAIAMEPPPRHANIVGWPVNPDPEMQKAHRKEIALGIAARCVLVRVES